MSVLVVVVIAVGALTACATSEADPTEVAKPEPSRGTITFGSVASPEIRFSLDPTNDIAWTTVLAAPVDETSVNIIVSESGNRTELFGYRQFITDPGATTLTNEMPLGRFLPNPGVYVMRYLSLGGDVLAEGEFELVAASN